MATAKKTTTKKAAPKAPAAKKAAPAPSCKLFTVGGNDHTVDIVRDFECLVKNKVSGIRKWVKHSDMEGV